MNWKALIKTVSVLLGWAAIVVGLWVVTGFYVYANLNHRDTATIVLIGLLFVAPAVMLATRSYVLEEKAIELENLKETQKSEGTVVLKRGPKGRFVKAEIK